MPSAPSCTSPCSQQQQVLLPSTSAAPGTPAVGIPALRLTMHASNRCCCRSGSAATACATGRPCSTPWRSSSPQSPWANHCPDSTATTSSHSASVPLSRADARAAACSTCTQSAHTCVGTCVCVCVRARVFRGMPACTCLHMCVCVCI